MRSSHGILGTVMSTAKSVLRRSAHEDGNLGGCASCSLFFYFYYSIIIILLYIYYSSSLVLEKLLLFVKYADY